MRLFEQTGRTSLRRPLPAGHQARAQGQVQEAHALQMPLLFFFIPFSDNSLLVYMFLCMFLYVFFVSCNYTESIY